MSTFKSDFQSATVAFRWTLYTFLRTYKSKFINQTLWRFPLKDLSIDEMVGPDALAAVRPTGVYLLDFFCSSIQFVVLLSPYLFFNFFFIS